MYCIVLSCGPMYLEHSGGLRPEKDLAALVNVHIITFLNDYHVILIIIIICLYLIGYKHMAFSDWHYFDTSFLYVLCV